MKALKKILISLLIIVVLLVVVSFFLPGDFKVEKQVVIKAPMETVYSQIHDFRNVNHWGPWYEMDTAAEYTYEGEPGEVGSKMVWKSENPKVGNGQLVRESSEMGASIVNKLVNLDAGNEATDKYTFEQLEGGEVKVTWEVEGSFGNMPWHKYMLIIFKPMMEEMFEKGLANLKTYAEDPANQKPTEPETMQVNGFDAQIMNIEERTVVGIRTTIPANEFDSSDFAENYGKLGEFCGKNKIDPMGAPIAIYHSYDPEGMVDVTFAFPVAADATAPKSTDITIMKVPAAQVLEITYVGPYSGMEPTWMAVDGWLAEKGLMQAGEPWEEYIDDPANVAESELRTKIVIPVSPKAETPVVGNAG